jgi:hypothetical protein
MVTNLWTGVATEAIDTWQHTGDAGLSLGGQIAVTSGAVLDKFVNVEGIQTVKEGRDRAGRELTLGARVFVGLESAVQIVGTAFAIQGAGGAGFRGGATSAGPKFRTWNQFQAGTTGQFASRAEAATAWKAYKEANGIVTGVVRSQAVKRQFLKSLVDNPNTASWMKQWLAEGRVPPGYEVDHIKPLSIGGPDTPANMRLQGVDLHDLWHFHYHPWTEL